MAKRDEGFLTIEEVMKRADRQRNRMAKKIFYDPAIDCIVLVARSHCRYEIGMDSIKDKSDILYWCAHLSQKNWVTSKLLSLFIGIACGRIGQTPWK